MKRKISVWKTTIKNWGSMKSMKTGETVNDSAFELRTDDKRTLRDTTYFFLVSYLPVVPRLCEGKQRRKSSISMQDHAEQYDSSSVPLHSNVSGEENTLMSHQKHTSVHRNRAHTSSYNQLQLAGNWQIKYHRCRCSVHSFAHSHCWHMMSGLIQSVLLHYYIIYLFIQWRNGYFYMCVYIYINIYYIFIL